MIFFIYGTIALLTFSIVIINIQPFKVVSHYPSTDSIFFILLSLVFTAAIARDIAIMGKFSIIFTVILLVLTVFFPIIYIASLISFWMISRIRQNGQH